MQFSGSFLSMLHLSTLKAFARPVNLDGEFVAD